MVCSFRYFESEMLFFWCILMLFFFPFFLICIFRSIFDTILYNYRFTIYLVYKKDTYRYYKYLSFSFQPVGNRIWSDLYSILLLPAIKPKSICSSYCWSLIHLEINFCFLISNQSSTYLSSGVCGYWKRAITESAFKWWMETASI